VLLGLYYEGTDGTPMTWVDTVGTCVTDGTLSEPHVQFSAVSMLYPSLATGYTVSGPDIDIPSGTPGAATLGSSQYVVLPFETVDCSECGSPGWYELHAILWDSTMREASFGIFYLSEGASEVLLAYALTLPTLASVLPTQSVTATWSKTEL
jgi:hypothetical protein